jgi:hypothetical protein
MPAFRSEMLQIRRVFLANGKFCGERMVNSHGLTKRFRKVFYSIDVVIKKQSLASVDLAKAVERDDVPKENQFV